MKAIMEKRAIMNERSKVSEYSSLKITESWPRTVEGDKPGNGLPNPPPPRVGAHADEEGEKGHDAKANGHEGQVTRTSPGDAEEAILLLTAITNALGEITAFEGREDLLPIAIWVGYPEHLTLATFHEAIADNVLGVEKLSSWVDEPGIKSFKRWIRCKSWLGLYQSVRWMARIFLNRAVVVIDTIRMKD